MNNSSISCGLYYKPALIALGAANGVSAAACFVAVVAVGLLKLHKKTVYRLALYQILASLELSIVLVLQVQFLNSEATFPANKTMCIATAFFFLQSQWTKLILAVWVTIHLFCFAVFHKNLQKFELLYVLSSLLLSFAIATVPLATGTYGLAGSWCWIQEWMGNCPTYKLHLGFVLQLALWYVPSIIILFMTSAAMVVMVLVVATRSCPRRLERHSITGEHHNRKALKQLLPLAAYPIMFCIFNVVPFVNRVRGLTNDTKPALETAAALSIACWGLSTAIALLIHTMTLRCLASGQRPRDRTYGDAREAMQQ